ncbi:helix-turn-helix domain containing protein (plasmid) [Tistrella mobilis]|uniref:helix-turn-helix domain-containing protein n=1 Tax=Tistrella mobilis TaxID=171437 RepID=UPI0035575E5D
MRLKKPGRLEDIAAAALAVFTRQGYRLTQMADVAREAGLSAGALYSYVAGKEALFELALAEAQGLTPAGAARFEAVGLGAAAAALVTAAAGRVRRPALDAALAAGRAGPDEVRAVAVEMLEMLATHRRLIWLLDRCAAEIPEVAAFYGSELRGRYFRDLTRFAALAAGETEPGPATRARARALLEMAAWMAMHRLRDPQPPAVDDATAHAAVVEIMLASLASCPATTSAAKEA